MRSRVAVAQSEIDVEVFASEGKPDSTVVISNEHDRYEWVPADELDRCLPRWVGEMYREVVESVSGA